MEAFPEEPLQQLTEEETVELPVPQYQEDIAEVNSLSPQERTSDCIAEQSGDVLGLQKQEQIVEDVKVTPAERSQQRAVEPIADMGWWR